MSKTCLYLMLLVFIATPALADNLEGSCQLRFYGDSTLHSFDGQGACTPFILEIENRDGSRYLDTAQVEVPVAGFDTDNSSRDKTMRGMFDSELYPKITGTFSDLRVDALLADWQATGAGELPFMVTVRDVTRPVTASVIRLSVTPEQVTATFELPVSLADFGLEAPGVLGIIRVADAVRVEIDLQLKGTFNVPGKEVSQIPEAQ
ncbi:MAG: hypothetical protein C0624_11225 [Desulfuromonas sp.]|nr:MAG: hypothetical protein C0624_11225 [Desulfuromonas sp.]